MTVRRQVPFKLGIALAATVLIAAMTATGAHAQIHPPNTSFIGIADDPMIGHGGSTILCDTGTVAGATGDEEFHVNLELDFFDCSFAGMPAPVECSDASGVGDEFGTARWEMTNAATNEGVIDQLNPDFECVVAVAGVCTIRVGAQELPSDVDGTPGRDQADLLNEGAETPPDPVNDTISVVVDFEATRSGSALCGPAQGDGALSGAYVLDTNITFD